MKAHRESMPPGRRMVRDAKGCYPDWAAVYADNAIWVYRMIFNRVGNQADAEDLTTEVFLAALRPLRLSATAAEVRGYLRATTRSVLSSYWRAAMDREITSIDDVGDLPHNAEQAIGNVPQQLDVVLAALPDNYPRMLELSFLQGCSVKGSASYMGVSVANAKVLQHRALRLAAELREEREQRWT
jgi:RNA polymerase sigma factor (sigma-70 family)